MPSRLTLTLPRGSGSREVEVDTKRFSIGRTPENDLSIDDTSLSRRHALIENFDGRFNLSDCGSSNGTFVNGTPVTGFAELRDRDVLTFGGIGDIVVRIKDDSQSAPAAFQGRGANAASAQYLTTSPSRNMDQRSKPVADQFWFSVPVIATAAVVVILLVTGLVLLASRGSTPRPIVTKKPTPRIEDTDNDNDLSRPSPTTEETSNPTPDGPSPVASDDPQVAELSTIERYASKVLTGISKDTHPVLTERPLKEINAQVKRYKGSATLQEELRAMKRAIPQASTAAKSNGVRTPLVVYATLARIDKDGRGDPAQVAGQLSPVLARMRAIFGDELANDSLLSVAALEEGPGLQGRITKLAGRVTDSPTTLRSIWYLRDHQVISSDTYDLVLRFLAIGVIAQDPQKFNIAAEALSF
jgi:predicted component of type VI protein secretion system